MQENVCDPSIVCFTKQTKQQVFEGRRSLSLYAHDVVL